MIFQEKYSRRGATIQPVDQEILTTFKYKLATHISQWYIRNCIIGTISIPRRLHIFSLILLIGALSSAKIEYYETAEF